MFTLQSGKLCTNLLASEIGVQDQHVTWCVCCNFSFDPSFITEIFYYRQISRAQSNSENDSSKCSQASIDVPPSKIGTQDADSLASEPDSPVFKRHPQRQRAKNLQRWRKRLESESGEDESDSNAVSALPNGTGATKGREGKSHFGVDNQSYFLVKP